MCIAFFVIIINAQIKLHFSNEFSIALLSPKFFNVPCGGGQGDGSQEDLSFLAAIWTGQSAPLPRKTV